MCEPKSKNKSNKKCFFSGPACKNESIIVKTRSSKNFSRIFKKNQLQSKIRSRKFFFRFDLYKCVKQNQKINRTKNVFFRARLVKMSPSLSKLDQAKILVGFLKKTNYSQKLGRGNFFLGLTYTNV